jgi:3-deoxy-7-phosphoheptulonate synthase
MVVIMNDEVTSTEVESVGERLQLMGLDARVSKGVGRTVIGAIGNDHSIDQKTLAALPGVDSVVRVIKPYQIVSRESKTTDSVVLVRNVPIGGETLQVIGGPCSVEAQAQIDASAKMVREAGCRLMRGGAFKPRTSPYAFQGLGVQGLKMFRRAADTVGLPIVTELTDVRMLDTFLECGVDMIQIGARNMQNFDLLKELGRINTPVLLKRGISATIHEWLLAAEYIAAGGNHNIVLCERGIRGFETSYRNVFDVTAIPVAKRETHLPVLADPSHAGGKAWMVPALARAAIAAGADGLLIEMHPRPCEALCDADQALDARQLTKLMSEVAQLAAVIGRSL